MNTTTQYGIYAACALTVIAVGGNPLILTTIALIALLTWKGQKQ
ncbi:MAG: hypothetical protein SPI77_04235 [Corynebacterium sp.]|nr:hypothetical protein [Corynebacterium sp.]